MTQTPLRRRLARLEVERPTWRCYEDQPVEVWPTWALDAYVREVEPLHREAHPEIFAGRPSDDPVTDEGERRMAEANEDAPGAGEPAEHS